MSKSCYFIGHASAPDDIYPRILSAIRQHIVNYGVTQFYVGHYGRFDSLVTSALREIKAEYPEITIMRVLPYHPAIRAVDTPKGFDGTYYPFEDRVPPRYAIVKANTLMINTVDYLIAYVNGVGKSRDFLEHALRREKSGLIIVTNLGSCSE